MATAEPSSAQRWTTPVVYLFGALAMVGLAGCGSESPPPTEPVLTGALTGLIVDHDGLGVPGVDVAIARNGAETRVASTDSQGWYRMKDVTVGPWDLSVFPPEGFFEDPDVPPPSSIETSAGDTTRIDIQLLGLEAAIPQTAPVLLSPAEGVRLGHFPRMLTAQWLPTPFARYFIVEWQYCGAQDFACNNPSASIVGEVEDTVFHFVFVGDQVGRWRVRAVGVAGIPGPASTWRHFEFQTSNILPLTGRGTATVDGDLGPGEWSQARALQTVVEIPERAQALGTLYLMNDDTTFYSALRFDWGGPHLYPSFMSMAAPSFGSTFEGHDLFGILYVGGANRVRAVDQHVVPGTGCGHLWCGADDVEFGGTFDGATAWTTQPAQTVIEIAKPLASGDVRDLLVQLQDTSIDVRFDLRVVIDDLLGIRSVRSTPQRFFYLLDRTP